jgi:hypothetical protein
MSSRKQHLPAVSNLHTIHSPELLVAIIQCHQVVEWAHKLLLTSAIARFSHSPKAQIDRNARHYRHRESWDEANLALIPYILRLVFA